VTEKVDLNPIIAKILRCGVVISSVLIALGTALLLAKDTPSGFPESINQVVSEDYGRPTTNFHELLFQVTNFDPLGIITLGLLILLATPVVRVAASVFLFALEKDWKFVIFTVVVLSILLFSIFVVGPAEAHAR
jgi:Predicted membrane protein